MKGIIQVFHLSLQNFRPSQIRPADGADEKKASGQNQLGHVRAGFVSYQDRYGVLRMARGIHNFKFDHAEFNDITIFQLLVIECHRRAFAVINSRACPGF